MIPPPPPSLPPQDVEEIADDELLDKKPEFLDYSIDANEIITEAPPVEVPLTTPAPLPLPPRVEDEAEVILFAEQMPRFPGCEDIVGNQEEKRACAEKRLIEYISSQLKYPQYARESGIKGRVVIQFVVEKDGTVSNVQVIRDIGGGCGAEAARVVKLMNALPERWIPGRQGGRPVRVQFTLPIVFRSLQ